MANSKRRADYTDRNGAMFMPMNVEGGNFNEHFMTTPKLVTLGGIVFALGAIIMDLGSKAAPVSQYIVWIGIWFIISLQLTRFIIFEEKFYYRMYKEMQEHEITSPAIFWDIASIKDTDEGALIQYSDARIAIIVKVERDTITGKQKDFKETHYDAISDFYREVATNKYSFVQMNIMEQAGKDPRLNELSKIVYKSDNKNINKLMEMQVGHIKNITHKALYESDYFLFYTNDFSNIDNIIPDITECLFKLLDGAYVSFQILSSKEIVELVKEDYGVTYFNSTQASLTLFDKTNINTVNPFNVTGIVWENGNVQTLNPQEKNKLRNITSNVIDETVTSSDISLKDTLYREETKNKVGIDFSELANIQSKPKKDIKKNGNSQKTVKHSTIKLAKDNEVKQTSKVNLNKTHEVNSSVEDDEYIDI